MKAHLSGLITSLLLIIGCQKDSPLEDVVLNDVSLLTQEIKINETGSFDYPSTTPTKYHQGFEVIIEDKNGKPLQIKNAKVSVNGELCAYGKPIKLSNDRYYLKDFRANPNVKEYTTSIVLENNSLFETTVTPPSLLNGMMRLNPSNFTVTWPSSPIENRINTTLTIAYTTKSGNVKVFGNPFIKIEDSGSYNFKQILVNDPDYINDNFTEIRFTLQKLGSGKLSDNGFRKRPKFFFGLSNEITVKDYKKYVQ